MLLNPPPHSSGVKPPKIQPDLIPNHIAVVMDGNGRWAKERGLPRTAGHEAGEASLMDCIYGSLELGVNWLSAYAFSTENWRRSPEEVRFLMNFNRDVIRRRRDEMNDMGVRIRWAGRRTKLWRSVIEELETCEKLTAKNSKLTVTMCVNYGGRAEIVDAVSAIAQQVADGKIDPKRVTEKTIKKYLDEPDMPDVDLFVRSSGEQRLSNFLLWQIAYAELYFTDILWPDFKEDDLYEAIISYQKRERRFGKTSEQIK